MSDEQIWDNVTYFLKAVIPVTGPVPKFSETFIGEGCVDMMEAMKTFYEAGVDAAVVEDHVPILEEGSGKQYRTRHGLYIKTLMDAARN